MGWGCNERGASYYGNGHRRKVRDITVYPFCIYCYTSRGGRDYYGCAHRGVQRVYFAVVFGVLGNGL